VDDNLKMWWTLKETGNALPFHFCPIRLNGRPDWSDITVCTKEFIHVSVHAKYKPNVQESNQARYHARVLCCFPDPLLAWTFYCSSDSCLPSCKGTVSHVRYECIQFTSRHHLLYSNIIPQHPVPLASMNSNRSHQHPQHPWASSVAPFSPHLKDCPLYYRNLFCFSIFFCRSVTHRSPDLPSF
jgi:hypothetical protein